MKAILGGHWQAAPAGWTEFKESQCDITKPLPFADGSVDAIFTEHVIEHISFVDAIGFMRQAFRALKPGGVLRTVAPMVHVFTKIDEHQKEFMSRYAKEQMAPYYPAEIKALDALGVYGGIEADLRPFIVNFLVQKHGHQFCWSGDLMAQVLRAIGFESARVSWPGASSYDLSTCLERRIRGTHAENLERDFGAGIVFDPESGVVEAKK